MKYLLYLELSRLTSLESLNPETTGASKNLPGWLQWLWQHRHGGARDFALLETNMLEPIMTSVVLLETNRVNDALQVALDQGHTLVLEWQGTGTSTTMRMRTKALDKSWQGIPDSAVVIKAIRNALRHCTQATKTIKRQKRMQESRLTEEQIIQQFARCVEEHSSDTRCNIPDLARLCGISNVRLQQICQKHWGHGPKAYLVQQRIRKACELIRNWPENRRCLMSRIAKEAGFSSPSYFASLFLTQTGQTPTEFRHVHLQNVGKSAT
ncbi:MAG: AraC family transcriptional regulator [Cytophagia bacterium]|nr:AraC family transcriptional regulator [Cytophagia bacterium]